MYSVYLALSVAAVLCVVFNRDFLEEKSIGQSVGISICVALVWMFANVVGNSLVPHHEVLHGPTELAAVKSADGISGTFVWGSGGFESSSYYNMLARNNDKSLSPYRVEVNSKVRIIEDENLETVGYWTSIWSEPNFEGLDNWLLIQTETARLIRHEIRVPKGTVIQNFSIE